MKEKITVPIVVKFERTLRLKYKHLTEFETRSLLQRHSSAYQPTKFGTQHTQQFTCIAIAKSHVKLC